MIYTIPTHFEELTLVVKVSTKSPRKIRIKVIDADQPNTSFTDRFKTINGQEEFQIFMPITGRSVLLSVFNEAYGEVANDNSFSVDAIYKEPLVKKLEFIDYNNLFLVSFLQFAKRFCYNAATLDVGSYVSDDKRFLIQYDNIIEDNGEEQTTPARIDTTNGRIEVSKKQFIHFTIPNRMAILLHEFSHVYLNDNVDDEIEADLNGLLIYLSLGYPRIEAFEVFGKTFQNAPSEENRTRYDKIKKFIDNFDEFNTYLTE